MCRQYSAVSPLSHDTATIVVRREHGITDVGLLCSMRYINLVRTQAVLLLTLTLMLTFQPKTIALAGYPKVIPYTKFEHFGIIRF